MDTVANLLTSLVNASRAQKKRIDIPYSRFSERLLQFLQTKGYVAKVRTVEARPVNLLRVTLAYEHSQGVLSGMKRVSSPGQRRYVGKDKLPYTNDRMGIVIVSTPIGLLDSEAARKKRVGGELICEIW